MTIDDIFEADGDLFKIPSINRGVLLIERNGNKELISVHYKYLDTSVDDGLLLSDELEFNPMINNLDSSWHKSNIQLGLCVAGGLKIELLTFNIFRN